MNFGIFCVLTISVFLQACSAGKLSPPKSAVVPSGQPVAIRFAASKERAVLDHGSYRLYVGRQAGFLESEAFKTVDVPGSAGTTGTVNTSITGLPAGNYFLKIQARTELVNPNTGIGGVSELSDEISFTVQ